MIEIYNITMPTLLIGELLIFFFTIINLYHAIKNGYNFIELWFLTITTGFINDHIFMLLSLSNTFWHAEGSIMLTERMPLYILGIYNILLYPSIILTNNIILSSFISGIIYAIYDFIGVNFIWWSWHTTDTSVLNRWYGVPYSSTCWSIIHVYSFFLMYKILKTKIFINILITPIMMILMGIFSYPINNGIYCFNTLVFICFSLIILYLLNYNNNLYLNINKSIKYSSLIYSAIFIYFLTMISIYIFGNPSNHISYGIHQTYGPKEIYEYDILGKKRQKYLSLDDNYKSFKLYNIPKLFTNKYSIQGI